MWFTLLHSEIGTSPGSLKLSYHRFLPLPISLRHRPTYWLFTSFLPLNIWYRWPRWDSGQKHFYKVNLCQCVYVKSWKLPTKVSMLPSLLINTVSDIAVSYLIDQEIAFVKGWGPHLLKRCVNRTFRCLSIYRSSSICNFQKTKIKISLPFGDTPSTVLFLHFTISLPNWPPLVSLRGSVSFSYFTPPVISVPQRPTKEDDLYE